MPKLKRSDAETRYILMAGNIRKRMDVLQLTDKEMGILTGLSEKRFSEKRRKPELFTYPELMATVIRLHMPDQEILEGMR